jgi:hypothetical protein
MGYNQDTFLLIELGRRYIISIDGKAGVSMREAKNFSEEDGNIFRTVRQGEVHVLEAIRTFPDAETFAQQLESL